MHIWRNSLNYLAAYTAEKLTSLRFVCDKINVNIRGLALLGIKSEQYGSLLIPIIMTKLLQELRLHFACGRLRS